METKEIIDQLHLQWLVAKEQRRQRCAATHMSDVADRLASCDMFKGTEDIAELARLFTSPQGIEFCLAANFPNLSVFRLFKRLDNPQKYGFYIDAGAITLKNPQTAVLIGRTSATIVCDTCSAHTVVTMHGASATILASGWSVVRAEAGTATNIMRRTSDHAIIL